MQVDISAPVTYDVAKIKLRFISLHRVFGSVRISAPFEWHNAAGDVLRKDVMIIQGDELEKYDSDGSIAELIGTLLPKPNRSSVSINLNDTGISVVTVVNGGNNNRQRFTRADLASVISPMTVEDFESMLSAFATNATID